MKKTAPGNCNGGENVGYRDVLNTIHESYEHISIQASYILRFHRYLYKYSERGIEGRFRSAQNYTAATYPDGT